MSEQKKSKLSMIVVGIAAVSGLGILATKTGILDDILGKDDRRRGAATAKVKKKAPPPKLEVPKQSNVEVAAKIIENASNKPEAAQHISLVYTINGQERLAKATKLQAEILQSQVQIERAKQEKFEIAKEMAKASGSNALPTLEETEESFPGIVPAKVQKPSNAVKTDGSPDYENVMNGIELRGVYQNTKGEYIASVLTPTGVFEFKDGDTFGDGVTVISLNDRKMVLSHEKSKITKPFYINLRS